MRDGDCPVSGNAHSMSGNGCPISDNADSTSDGDGSMNDGGRMSDNKRLKQVMMASERVANPIYPAPLRAGLRRFEQV